ncbi:MAG: RICIN domain-containing protein [Terrisporobacter sp.]|uniref:RICIN domain-containing protein n=1 Tax=Terrisporobacter sp. TaxID=1965305 RepID=UPI002FC66758
MRGKFKKIVSRAIAMSILIGQFAMPMNSDALAPANISSGYYNFKNLYSSKYLNVSGAKDSNGTNININAKDNSKGQTFKIYKLGTSYGIAPRSSSNGKLVNIKGDYAKPKSNVMLYSKVGSGHSTQKWIFEKVSGGYIIRSVNNSKYVLTADGNSNGSNINVQSYSKKNKNQIWTLQSVKVDNNSTVTKPGNNTSSKGKTVTQIKGQIQETYKKSRRMTGRSHFKKQCSLYVFSQLKALGIYQTPNTYWNGNRWYSNLKSNGVTKTGYVQKKYSGKNCLNKVVSANKKNIYNVVVTFPHSYTSGKNKGSGGAGHVLFIHAIIDGKVYYSDNYKYGSIPEGGVIVKSISEFNNYFSYHYGGITGAVHFIK